MGVKDPSGLMKIEGKRVKDLDRMYEGFKSNMANGYETSMIKIGRAIHLTCNDPKGFIGIVTIEK